MVVYKNTAQGFMTDVDTNKITEVIECAYRSKYGRTVGASEKRSWANSMEFMNKAVRRSEVASDCGVLIEYNIPATSKRIDFTITGKDEDNKENFIIVELKQWEYALATDKDGIVKTLMNRHEIDTTHPSYQASTYKQFLQDYNQGIYDGNINAYSCAYLHNYHEQNPEPLKADSYATLVLDSPIFFRADYDQLEDFLRKHVGKGAGMEILYKIENGKIKPSKKLINHVNGMFKGNKEFILLDEQKIAYENALDIARKVKVKEKSVVIIKGGPGTGKSVISINLLGGLLKLEKNVVFVAPNAAFRHVMVQKLAKDNSRARLNHLFKGSSAFVGLKNNYYDVIVVDEAHRLKNKDAYMYRGKNQVEDIVKAGKTVIFFVDENQMVRPDDIGSLMEIRRVAEAEKAIVTELDLVAQFRCAGAEGYLNWLDNILHIKETANFDGWDKKDFEFKIFKDPNELRKAIKEKNDQGHQARILAGYAWNWTPERQGNRDGEVADVCIPELDFKMPWNSRRVGTTWAVDPSGVDQVGCIHTSQGLEFDYVGVIVGNDLRFNPEKLKYYVDWDSYKDVNGKRGLRNEPVILSRLVRNIYRTLMSRGMKGCYVYFMDKEMEKFFERML